MARKKNNGGALLIGPVLTVLGVLALWHNEGRFDYYKASLKTKPLGSPEEAAEFDPETTISYTGTLERPTFPGRYIQEFGGYYRVQARSEIYSWDRSEDSDGDVTWSKGWYSSLDNNNRNSGLSKKLKSFELLPERYQVDDLTVAPEDLHFVDPSETIAVSSLSLNQKGASLGLKPEPGSDSGYFYLRKRGSGGGDTLGDERVSYVGIPVRGTATYFGWIDGDRKNGEVARGLQVESDKGFVSKLILDDGILHHLANGDREVALKQVKAHFIRLKWIVRGAGTLAIFLGILIFLSKLLQVLTLIPIVGQLAGFGTFLLSLCLSILIAGTTIVVSWLVHSPVVALLIVAALLIGILALFIVLQRRGKQNARRILESQAASPPVPTIAGGYGAPSPVSSLAPATAEAPPQPPTSSGPPPWVSGDLRAQMAFTQLVKLSLLDDHYDEKENDFLVKWARDKGIDDETIVELFEKARDEPQADSPATGSAPPSIPAPQREDLTYLVALALSDGHLSPKELEHIQQFASRSLGMTKREVSQVIADVQRGTADLALPA